jgi:3-mercaptopyruvate sulfurtransferase SseA
LRVDKRSQKEYDRRGSGPPLQVRAEVVEVVGHIPAAVLATWGVDSNWGKVFGGSRPTQRTSRKRPPLTARRGIHSGGKAAASESYRSNSYTVVNFLNRSRRAP